MKLSRIMTKPTKWHVRPTKTLISLGLSYPWSAQRILWSDWADAQADLSLRGAYSHFVGFFMLRLNWFSVYNFRMNEEHFELKKKKKSNCLVKSRFWQNHNLWNFCNLFYSIPWISRFSEKEALLKKRRSLKIRVQVNMHPLGLLLRQILGVPLFWRMFRRNEKRNINETSKINALINVKHVCNRNLRIRQPEECWHTVEKVILSNFE